MPPVLKIREEIDKILFKDPAMLFPDDYKFVFTDISPSAKDRVSIFIIIELNYFKVLIARC